MSLSPRTARRRVQAVVLSLLAACTVASCGKTEASRGGLMLIVSQEGSLPVGRVDVSVSSNGKPLLSQSYKVPEEAQLPTTIAVVSNGDPTAQATISVTGWELSQGKPDVPLDRRDAIVTQIPVDRVAELKVVLTARCTKWVDGSGQPACQPTGYTCDSATGACVAPDVVATNLTTYQAGDETAGNNALGGSGAVGGSTATGGHTATGGRSGAGGANVASGGASGSAVNEESGAGGERGPVDEGGAGGRLGGAGAGSCTIGAASFSGGDKNPADGCLLCDPTTSATAWTKAADGASCASGKVCRNGTCAAGCFVDSVFYAAGVGQAGNAICDSCDPAKSTSDWTPAADGTGCGSAQVCSTGVCRAGCFVDGAYRTAGQGKQGNTVCQTCQPALSTTAWSAASEGTVCPTNQFCHDGACSAGCFIGGTFYARGAVNGCQTCQPDKSTSAWTNADGMACAGGSCCSNVCVNEQTSNANCGGCGLACPSGCSAGECVVQACANLGSLGQFSAIGFDSKNAYLTHTNGGAAGLTWVSLDGNCTLGSDPNNGAWEAVNSISVTSSGVAYSLLGPPYPSPEMHYIVPGGSTVKVGVMKAPSVPITSDANNVYWLDFTAGAGNVVKAPISGAGPVTPLAPITAAGGIAIDGTYVYWADSSSVKRVAIAGGANTITTLVPNVGSPGFLFADATNLYWTGVSSALFRLPLSGTTSTQLMSSGQTLTYPASGPSTFYWSTGTTINSISLTGGAVGTASASPVKLLYTAPASHGMVTLGVHGNSLFWVDSSNGSLWKMTPN